MKYREILVGSKLPISMFVAIIIRTTVLTELYNLRNWILSAIALLVSYILVSIVIYIFLRFDRLKVG